MKRGASEKDDMVKVYIALYACLTRRAVHLDVIPDLSAETLIRSFNRFICRRGILRMVVSDNAKTFKTAARVQSFLLNHKER